MTDRRTNEEDADALRKDEKTAQAARTANCDANPSDATSDPQTLLRDLEVHQIDLEKQNVELRRTQAELELLRERYFDLYNLAPVGYCILNTRGLIVEANITLANMLGLRPIELPKTALSRFVIPEDLASFDRFCTDLFAGVDPQVCQIRFAHQAGDTLWVNLSANEARVEDGSGQYRFVLSDITAKKREVLRESELQLQFVTDHAPIALVHCDHERRYKFVNQQYAAIFGLSPTEIIGKYPQDILDEETYAHTAPYMETVLAGDPVEYDLTLPITASGPKVIHVSYTPEIDESGRVVGFVAAMADITERKQAEAALRESERRYSSMLENIDLISMTLDREGRVTFCNPSLLLLTGWRHEEVIGSNWFERFIPTSNAELYGKFVDMLDGRTLMSNYENEILTRSGNLRLIHWSNTVLRSTSGAVIGTASIGEDITERKATEVALRESETRFHSALDGMLEGCQIIAHDWTYLYINAAAERQNRRPNEMLLGRKFQEVWPGIREHVVYGAFKRCMEQRTNEQIHIELVFPEGEKGWFNVSLHPVQEGIFLLAIETTERERAEKALGESQAMLTAAMESMSDAVYISDAKGNVIHHTEAFAQYHRFSSKAECPTQLADYPQLFDIYLIDGTPVAIEDRPMPRALRGDVVSGAEYKLRRKDTGEAWYGSYNFSPIQDGKGAITGAISVARDITHIMRREEELRESERFLSATLDGLGAHIAIIDKEGRILRVNEAWRQFAKDNDIGQDVAGEGTNYLVVCEDSCGSVGAVEFALGTRDVLEGRRASFSQEYPCHAPDEQRWFIGIVTRFPGDGPIRAIIAHENITERKLAMVRLKESLDFKQNLIDSMQDGFSVLDAHGVHIEVNPALCAMTGFSRDELIGSGPPHPYWDHDQQESIDDAFQQSLEGKVHSIELRFRRKNGKTFPVVVSPSILRSLDGTVQYVLATVKDMSVLHRLEQDYETLFREMLNGFALHEIICDDDGNPIDYRFLAINPAFEALTGLRAEDTVGKTLLEIMPETERAWIECYGKVALGGVPITFTRYNNTLEKYYKVSAFQPQQGQFAAVFEDITERKKAEASLKITQFSVDYSGLATFRIDAGGQLIYVNQAACESLGYTEAELLAMYEWDIAPLMSQARWTLDWEQCRREGAKTFEMRHRRKDGSEFLVEVQSSYLQEAGQEFIIAFATDIAARIEAEKRYQESEARFRRALDVVPFPLLMHAEDGEILLVSQEWTAITGYSIVEIPTISAWTKRAYGRAKDMMEDVISRLYHQDRRTEEGEFTITCKDGAHRNWEFSSIGVGELPDGRRLAISMAVDVTDRKKASLELQQSEKRLANLVGNLQGMVYRRPNTRDLPMNYASRGALELTGYSPEVLVGNGPPSYGDLIHEKDRDSVWFNIQTAVENRKPFELKYRILDSAGKVRWVWERGLPVPAESGQNAYLEGFVQDITELTLTQTALFGSAQALRELLAQLENAEEQERRRIADYVHDEVVQNLALAKIRSGGIRLNDEESTAAMHQIRDLLTSTINQLRELSVELAPPVLDHLGLQAALESLVEDFSTQHGLGISYHGPTQLEDIPISLERLLYRISRELLMNAVKHSQASAVWVTLSQDPDGLHLAVKDNGRGLGIDMDEADLRSTGGYGLYSISERIRYIGGDLQIQSAPGKGCEVLLSIPEPGKAPLLLDPNNKF